MSIFKKGKQQLGQSKLGFFLKKRFKLGTLPLPSHLEKQLIIQEFQRETGFRILIETGTYLGEMVEAQVPYFEKIYSIELSNQLYIDAVKKFQNFKSVKIFQGDSGFVLNEVLNQISEPVIFWLDGHYSSGITAKGEKECPIFEELNAIFKAAKQPHLLLIDDARLFNGTHDYPTKEKLKNFIVKHHSNISFEVKKDVIRIQLK